MWIQCTIEHQGPFEYDVPNGDGTFTNIPFARSANTGAQLANVTNRKHIRFLLEERPQHFNKWEGPAPDDGPPVTLSYPEMMARLNPAIGEGEGESGKAGEGNEGKPGGEKQPDAQTPGVDVQKLEGEALRAYATSIGMTNLPPKSTRDDTLRRAVLDHLELLHDADLEDLRGEGAGEADGQ